MFALKTNLTSVTLVWFRDEVKIIAVPSIPGGLIEVGKELASILKVFVEKYPEVAYYYQFSKVCSSKEDRP